ncbi:MAG: hypothetical protein ACRC92_20245 [Peptostreptococcaceae bacterium]
MNEKISVNNLNKEYNISMGADEMLVTNAPSLPILIAMETGSINNKSVIKDELLHILDMYTLSNLFILSLTDEDNANLEVMYR